MNLTDILSHTDLSIVVDQMISRRASSEEDTITVKQLKADDPSSFLSLCVEDGLPSLAAVTDSGRVYILSDGIRGVIRVQGSSANKAQKISLEKIAKALYEHDGLMLPDHYSLKLDPKKVVKSPEIVVDQFDNVVGDVDTPSD